MEKLTLDANIRNDKTNRVRSKGLIPAVVYGKGFDPMAVEVDGKKMEKVFSAGSNMNVLITLSLKQAGKDLNFPVLAHEMQKDAMNDRITHIDFLRINMEEEIKTKISILITGEAQGVKLDGGIMVQALRQLEVKCLPADIPDKIVVDVTALKMGESIHVRDIVPPKGVAIISSKDDAVVTVAMPAKEEEAAPAAAEAAVEGAAAEGAASAEGAAAAPAEGDAKAKAPAEGDAKAKQAAKPSK